MIDVETMVAESFARLYPVPSVTAHWDEVLSRSGLSKESRTRPRRSSHARLALVAAALVVVLLAGVATATYIGARLVYETPRVAVLPGVEWSNFVLGPDGHQLYAVRVPHVNPARRDRPKRPIPGAPQIVRIDGIDSQRQPGATTVLDFADASRAGLAVQYGSIGSGRMTGAPNGDLFFAAGCCLADTLSVLHRDGSWERILDGRTLIADRAFPAGMTFRIAASAPDRVWIWVDPSEGDRPQRLFEAIDPNADGDWGDRILRPVALPDSLPFAKPWRSTPRLSPDWKWFPNWRWQLAAEPSLPGDDRSRSVLAAALSHDTGEFRIYRIGDGNDDGDALDAGEVSLVFDRPQGGRGAYPVDLAGVPPQIAPLVAREGGVARRAIAVAGLTSRDRVALVSDSGAVREIGSVFPNSTEWPANGLSVVASAQGDMYAIVAKRTKDGLAWSAYRLDPGDVGGSE